MVMMRGDRGRVGGVVVNGFLAATAGSFHRGWTEKEEGKRQ